MKDLCLSWRLLVLLVTICTTIQVEGMVVERRGSNSNHSNNSNNSNNRKDSGRQGASRRTSRGEGSSGGRQQRFTSKNQSWYEKRKNQGIKVPRGKKPPQWEREGDELYQEIIRDNPYRIPNEKFTYEKAQELLENLHSTPTDLDTELEARPPSKFTEDPSTTNQASINSKTDDGDDKAKRPEPPFLWGGLSVGPVWKQRLVQAGFTQPTPIQAAAFPVISKRNTNSIMAAATGSGKSLAYLLPLLTTMGGTAKKDAKEKDVLMGKVWIITPTTELALQLQRVVTNLLGETDQPKTIHVLRQSDGVSQSDDQSEEFLQLQSIDPSNYILAGVPRAFRELMKEMDGSWRDYSMKGNSRTLSKNLQTIVLDEADRLLQTEAMARYYTTRSSLDPSLSKKQQQQQLPRNSKPLTLDLLETILSHPARNGPGSANNKVQVICASATVGRTLRRQLMTVVGATSMEKAATLITGDVRTKKDATARKASLLPTSLTHSYHLLPDICNDNDQELLTNMIQTIRDNIAPGPTLIFPGRTGVDSVKTHLKQTGFQNVGGLEDVGAIDSSLPYDESSSWEQTPIFVVSEKLGRGLDIPALSYVLLLQVPSSAAGYTHLAGRAGRNGTLGTTISMCRPREAPKLVRIAETLGLQMKKLV